MDDKEHSERSADAPGKKLDSKADHKRYSTREKKPVLNQDLGYVDREQGKKGLKGNYMASEAFKKCERIMQQLKKHECAERFMQGTEHGGHGKESMDLQTAERKLRLGEYTTTGQLALDIRKIWTNSWETSKPGTPVFISTTEISNFFEKLWKEVGDVPFGSEESNEILELKKQVSKVSGALRRMTTPSAVVCARPSGSHQTKGPMEKQMSIQEKTQLKQNIMKLPQDKLTGVIQIIKDTVDTSNSRDTLEFDLDVLPPRTCRELELYVKKNLPLKHGKKKPAGPEPKKPSKDPVKSCATFSPRQSPLCPPASSLPPRSPSKTRPRLRRCPIRWDRTREHAAWAPRDRAALWAMVVGLRQVWQRSSS